jgi:hypothetical protein
MQAGPSTTSSKSKFPSNTQPVNSGSTFFDFFESSRQNRCQWLMNLEPQEKENNERKHTVTGTMPPMGFEPTHPRERYSILYSYVFEGISNDPQKLSCLECELV